MQKKRTRRGSDNKNNNAKVTGRKNELIGVGLVALGLVLICGIMGLNVGFVGIYFAKFLQYFCGIGSMIPAVAFIYLGYNYIMKGTGFQLDKRSIGIGLMFVTLLSIFHHFMVPAGSEILPSELQRGGGLLGGIVLLFMRKLFGVAGAIVILGAGFVGSILLATTWSLANGIFKTQKGVEKGAEAAKKGVEISASVAKKGVEKSAEAVKDTAKVVYSTAKVVENKVEEQVTEQVQNIRTNVSAWQQRRAMQKAKAASFFNQESAEVFSSVNYEDDKNADRSLNNSGNAYLGSLSEGIGRDNDIPNQAGKGFEVAEEMAGAAAAVKTAVTAGATEAVLEEALPVTENVWGINSNPGKVLAKMQEQNNSYFPLNIKSDISFADENDSAEDDYDENDDIDIEGTLLEENSFADNDTNEALEEMAVEETEDDEAEDEEIIEDNETADDIADDITDDEELEKDPYEDEFSEDDLDEEIEEANEDDEELDEADDETDEDEDYEPFQSYGSSAKGRSWLDDYTDDLDDGDDEDLITVGAIGSTIPAPKKNSSVNDVKSNSHSEDNLPSKMIERHQEWQKVMDEEEKPSKVTVEEVAEENEEEKIEIPYVMPDIEELLDITEKADIGAVQEEINQKAEILAQTLSDFNVKAEILAASRGPAVTQYEVKPAPGVKVNKVTNLSDEIALNMAVSAVRIEIIPGKAAIGIEVPNTIRDSVPLREVLEQPGFEEAKSDLTVGLGMDIGGRPIFADLAKMPHLLVAGATGSGKSVCINTIISSILFKAHPDDVKFILVDPKMVELSVYNGIPHLMVPVVTDAKKAASVLNWSVQEMERRYEQLSNAGVRNMAGYNKIYGDDPEKKMCSLVIIIDELADLMMVAPHDVEDAICRIAQKARAAGIYLVLATQRPSVNVITGTIKANIPSRISFAVTSQIDSRTILDASGAEKLLGRGDMMFSPVGASKPTRIQGAFISDDEVERLLDFIRSQGHEIKTNQEIIEFTEKAALEASGENDNAPAEKKTKPKRRNKSDILMGEALELILSSGQASASNVQRRFRIGFATAQRIIDNMEELGILGPANGGKCREILVSGDEAREILADWNQE